MPGLERVTFQHLDTVQDRKDIFLIGRTIEGKSVAVKITDVRPHVCIEYEGERENVGSFIKILSQKVYEYECHTKILENIDKKKYTFPNTEQLSASDVPKDYITGEVFKGQNIVKYDESGAKLFLRIFSKDKYVLKYVKTFLSSTEIQMVKTIVYVSADSKTMNVPLHMSSLPKTYKGYELFVEKTMMVPTMGKHTLFNDHVDFTLQYLIDKDIYSCGFIEVEGFEKEKETTCDVELIAQSVRQVKVEGMAPWRILSYDIESVPREIVGRKNKYLFPVAEKDPICTIGVTLQISADIRTYAWILVGPGEDKKATLSLDALESPPDEYRPEKTTVYFHTDELEMIEDFVAFIIGKDVDFIEGHNINRFDNVYLLERYNVLKGGGKVEKFPIMGRLKRRVSRISVKTFNSNQKGSHEKYSLLLPGRVILDSYDIMKDQHNESSYKLDSLAEKYLGTKKIDQDYNTINPMWKSERGRHDLAVYCVKDSWLVRKMMDKLCKLTVLLQMSNVTGISMKDVIERGQGIRTIGLMLRYAMKRKDKQDKCEYLIPRLVKEVEMIKKKKYNFSTNKVEYVEYEKDPESFEGAIVVPPNTGFYKNAVSCLDFASLYPSIMRALNMSYETLVSVETVQKMGWKELEGKEEAVGVRTIPDFTYENMVLKVVKDQTKSPIFVSASTRKGLLPEMLESVLSERKSVKKQMKALKDPSCDMYKVLDGRQLGLKVVANSMYGFTGATTGFLPEKRIASSVTKYGRYMITQTKAKVENHPVWGRGGHRATCIYGDSVSGKTPLLTMCEGRINIVAIENLDLSKETFTWTEKGWTKILNLVKHRLAKHKKMLQIVTHSGIVQCTNDHSLVLDDGTAISPDDITVGTKLMHSFPSEFPEDESVDVQSARTVGMCMGNGSKNKVPETILNGSKDVRLAFLQGLCDANGSKHGNGFNISQTGHESCAGIYYLLRSLGFTVVVDWEEDAPNVFRIRTTKGIQKEMNKVKTIVEIPYEEWVYDLTTENHHFHAGIGDMIVHNTDSVFVHMPRSLVNGNDENELMANAHRMGEEMASYITDIFLPPNELEYEKSYSSFLLLCKKRYAGHKFEPGHKPSLQIKGLEAARRDYAPLLVETQKTMLNILLLERNVQKACDYVADTVYKLMNNQIPLEKFIMSKKLSKAPGDYNAPAAHVNLALRLTKENPDQAPVAGDRVDFVIFNSSSPKVSHSACLPSEIMSEKYTINVNYYLDKQLRGPLLRILEKVVDNPRDLFKCTSIFKARGINAYFKASEEGSSSKKRKENRRVLGFPKRVKVKETNPHRKVQTLDSMFKR